MPKAIDLKLHTYIGRGPKGCTEVFKMAADCMKKVKVHNLGHCDISEFFGAMVIKLCTLVEDFEL